MMESSAGVCDDCQDCGENSKHEGRMSVFHCTSLAQTLISLSSDRYGQNASPPGACDWV